ncbi:hypothetical protein C7B69_09570, partial [filamentous cyanobacterium Phorm 46]
MAIAPAQHLIEVRSLLQYPIEYGKWRSRTSTTFAVRWYSKPVAVHTATASKFEIFNRRLTQINADILR